MGTGCSAERSASMVQLNKDNIPNYKIVLIGDPGVGKTNILLRYTKNQFDYSYKPTRKPAIDNVVKKLNVPANVVVSVTLWDLPGREDMDLRSTYYKNVDAVIVVVDMSDEDSIELATTWRLDFLNKASRTREVTETLPNGFKTTHLEPVKDFDPRKVPMLLLGNKYDVVEDNLRRIEMMKMLNEAKEDPMLPLSEELANSRDEGKEDVEQNGGEQEEPQSEVKGTRQTQIKTRSENEKAGLHQKPTGVTVPANDHEGIKSDDDEEEWNNNEEEEEALRMMSPASEENKDPPKCVQLLEEIETTKGFVGSILVSAKDKDGSVDAAIQSLVRHLIQKSKKLIYTNPQINVKEKKVKKVNKSKKTDFVPLKKSGIRDLDSLFARSNVVLRRVHDYRSFYQVALHKFKQGCADLGLLNESKVSLEDCIVAVRDTVKENMERELMLVEEEEFVELEFHVDEEEDKVLLKQMRMFVKLMDDFRQEYCGLCKAILRENPTLQALLDKLDSRIMCRAEELWASVDPATKTGATAEEKAEVERVCDICEKNRARLAHATLQVRDNQQTVEEAKEKIKAALMW